MNLVHTILLSLIFSLISLLFLHSIKDKKIIMMVFIIIFIGCFVRLYRIDSYPVGLNQDEASIGYDAYSLLNYGIDRNGISNPVHLIAWGSGQNILYAYFIMPFIKIFGNEAVSIRLGMALVGCISLIISIIFIKKWPNWKGLLGLFLFAIMPWHIMKSRWGLESNLFPDLIFYGIVLLYFAIKDNKRYLLFFSSLIFGLSVYSYGTSYLYVPVLLIFLYIYLIKFKKVSWKNIFIHFGITTLVALPMILFVFINYFDLSKVNFLGMTIPKLPYNRFTTITSLNGSFFSNCFNNLINSIKLIISQKDGMLLNYIDGFGVYYHISIIFLLYGLYIYFKKYRKYDFINYAFLAFVSSIFVMMMVSPNINRMNIVWIPSYVFIIIGIIDTVNNKKNLRKCIMIFYGICFACFLKKYFGVYQQNIMNINNYGLREAILEIDDNKKIYITDSINQPYIFWLYYRKISPYDYLNDRVIENEYVMFQRVTNIGEVNFNLPNEFIKDTNYIVPLDYTHSFNECYTKSYGRFVLLNC